MKVPNFPDGQKSNDKQTPFVCFLFHYSTIHFGQRFAHSYHITAKVHLFFDISKFYVLCASKVANEYYTNDQKKSEQYHYPHSEVVKISIQISPKTAIMWAFTDLFELCPNLKFLMSQFAAHPINLVAPPLFPLDGLEGVYGPKNKEPRRARTHRGSQKRRLPTLAHTGCTTIGAAGLNFPVRNGKGWNPSTIAT